MQAFSPPSLSLFLKLFYKSSFVSFVFLRVVFFFFPWWVGLCVQASRAGFSVEHGLQDTQASVVAAAEL